MSASVGAICLIAKLEHLLHDLSNCGQRVELPSLHLVEQTPKLRIVYHRLLEMSLGAAGCDGEHLPREILAPSLLELSPGFEIRAMRLDLLPQLRDVLPGGRLGEDDRRLPGPLLVERQDRTHLV